MAPDRTLVSLCAVLLAAGAGPAATAPQLAGLFMQGCLPFAGDPARLRAWAVSAHLPEVPEPARAAFLNGAPGTVFDASNATGKYVVVSADDGLCSCVTETAAGSAVTTALEGDLRQAGIAFRMVIERDEKAAPDLHYREYLATRRGRSWRILAATVKDVAGGRAMLTAGPSLP